MTYNFFVTVNINYTRNRDTAPIAYRDCNTEKKKERKKNRRFRKIPEYTSVNLIVI